MHALAQDHWQNKYVSTHSHMVAELGCVPGNMDAVGGRRAVRRIMAGTQEKERLDSDEDAVREMWRFRPETDGNQCGCRLNARSAVPLRDQGNREIDPAGAHTTTYRRGRRIRVPAIQRVLETLAERRWTCPSRRFESKVRATGLVQQSTGKEVAQRPPHVVVKWSPNCVLPRVQKNEGGGKEVTERRPFSEGQKKKTKKKKKERETKPSMFFFFGKNLSLSVAVMTLSAFNSQLMFGHVA